MFELNNELYKLFLILLVFSCFVKRKFSYRFYRLYIFHFVLLYGIIFLHDIEYITKSGLFFPYISFNLVVIFCIGQLNEKHSMQFFNLLVILGFVLGLFISFGVAISSNIDFRKLYVESHGSLSKNYLFVSLYLCLASNICFQRFVYLRSIPSFILFLVLFLFLLLSHGRTSFFSILFIVFLTLFFQRKKLFFYSILFFVPFITVILYSPLKISDKVSSMYFGVRSDRWFDWLLYSISNFPTGGGIGVWYPHHPHNLFIQIFSEGGILCFVISIFMFLIPFFICIYFISKKTTVLLKYTCTSYIIVFFEFMKSHDIHRSFVFWIFLSLFIISLYHHFNIKQRYII